MKNIAICAVLALIANFSFGQSKHDAILRSVLQNSRELKAQSNYLESQRLYHRTGLAPENPFLGYDYMRGTPTDAGNQVDFTATQSFDFPSAYKHRKNLSDSRIAAEESAFEAILIEVLLETRQVCTEIIYLNKRERMLEKRTEDARKTEAALRRKFEAGEISVLDLNRAEIILLETERELREWQGEREAMLIRLSELNGGIPLELTDTIYSIDESLPSPAEIERLTLGGDPILQELKWMQRESENELSLSKSLRLPEFEAGYHYQAILGQTFNGLHIGMSLPLWQNRHSVAQKTSASKYAAEIIESYTNKLGLHITASYRRYLSAIENIEKYRTLLGSVTTQVLLNKTLEAGEISTIEYFLELRQYYSVTDEYLRLEKALQLQLVELRKYDLYELVKKL